MISLQTITDGNLLIIKNSTVSTVQWLWVRLRLLRIWLLIRCMIGKDVKSTGKPICWWVGRILMESTMWVHWSVMKNRVTGETKWIFVRKVCQVSIWQTLMPWRILIILRVLHTNILLVLGSVASIMHLTIVTCSKWTCVMMVLLVFLPILVGVCFLLSLPVGVYLKRNSWKI